MTNNPLVPQLMEALAKIPCINSHSHLPQEKERLADVPDALAFLKHTYIASDLSSAGMSAADLESAFDPTLPIEARWKLLHPFWPYVRMTGFVQSLLLGFKHLFGIPELSEHTLRPISDAVRSHSVPGYYRAILREKANIQVSIAQMNDLIEVDRTLFKPMPRLNRFSMIETRAQVEQIEQIYHVTIGSLRDLVSTIEKVCTRWREQGIAGVKLSQSYFRRMDFEERKAKDAAAVFTEILKGKRVELNSARGKVLGDYLVFECCRAASELDLTIQFHLGMRAGTYHTLEGCSPAPMVHLFSRFRNARFDLSHSGFPYLHEAGVLAKGWSNIFLNMDWIQAISPEGSKHALREWLRMVPYNKIIAYGDDVAHVEVAFGALVIARQNVATALAALIQEDSITESKALDIARAIFHDTPAKLYMVN